MFLALYFCGWKMSLEQVYFFFSLKDYKNLITCMQQLIMIQTLHSWQGWHDYHGSYVKRFRKMCKKIKHQLWS